MVNVTSPTLETALLGLQVEPEPQQPIAPDVVTTLGAGTTLRRSLTWLQGLTGSGSGPGHYSPYLYAARLFVSYNSAPTYNFPTLALNGYFQGIVYYSSGARNVQTGAAGAGAQLPEFYKTGRIEAPVLINTAAATENGLSGAVDLLITKRDGLNAIIPETKAWGGFQQAYLYTYPVRKVA